MQRVTLRGSLPASLCPFRPDLSIDEQAFAIHCRWLADASGGGGVVCNGHAGEVASLTREERRRVVEIAVHETRDRAPVVAGVYADSTAEAVILARDAEAAGAGALLVFPPPVFGGGGNRTPEMALAFVRAVADAVGVGIVVFQFPIAGLGYPTERSRPPARRWRC